MNPPKLTPEQRKEGLRKALQLRAERAELKKKLKKGEINLNNVFKMTGPAVERIRARDLLSSLPRVGKITAKKIMGEVKIAESRRIKGLGVRQKRDLLFRFGK